MRRLIPFFLIFTFSCGEGDYSVSMSDVKASSIVAIGALSSVMDEEASAGFSTFLSTDSFCLERAGIQACVNGRKSITYADCEATLNTTLRGTVSLNYSDNSCSLNTLSNSVTRSFDLIKIAEDGATLQIYSSEKVDYLGNLYGGGGRIISQGGSSYQLDILGKHIDRTRSSGFEGYEISMRTTSPVSVTSNYSDLRREGRSLTGGNLELAHNRLKYKTTYAFSNLNFSSGCCHPISGEINMTLSDGAQGTAQILFNNSCGSATITLNDVTETVILEDCNF